MQNLAIILVFGIPLSLIAATMVFLISYREYQHHFFETKKVVQMSLESALFTLGFFAVLLLVIWLSLKSMFPQPKY
jgi:uncharacterized membrane protein